MVLLLNLGFTMTFRVTNEELEFDMPELEIDTEIESAFTTTESTDATKAQFEGPPGFFEIESMTADAKTFWIPDIRRLVAFPGQNDYANANEKSESTSDPRESSTTKSVKLNLNSSSSQVVEIDDVEGSSANFNPPNLTEQDQKPSPSDDESVLGKTEYSNSRGEGFATDGGVNANAVIELNDVASSSTSASLLLSERDDSGFEANAHSSHASLPIDSSRLSPAAQVEIKAAPSKRKGNVANTTREKSSVFGPCTDEDATVVIFKRDKFEANERASLFNKSSAHLGAQGIRFKSIKVTGNCCWEMYERPEFGGRKLRICPGKYHAEDLNKKIAVFRSIKPVAAPFGR